MIDVKKELSAMGVPKAVDLQEFARGLALLGLRIEANELITARQRVQVRFPRSKRKRIRAKWAKRAANWRERWAPAAVFMRGTLYAHPTVYRRILKEIERFNRERQTRGVARIAGR